MVAWLMVIAWESMGLSGEVTGGWIARTLGRLLPLSHQQIMLTNHLLRKMGHFTGYALLSWFAFRGWMETLTYRAERALVRAGKHIDVRRRWHLRAALLAVLCTMLVAALDEFHQAFVPGRTGVFHDVVLDTMGALFAQFCLLLYWTGRRTPKAPARQTLGGVPAAITREG
jgi:VanZ family protein